MSDQITKPAAPAAVPNAGGEDLTPVAVAPVAGDVGTAGTAGTTGTSGTAGTAGVAGPEVPGSAAGASTGASSAEGLLQKAQAMAQPYIEKAAATAKPYTDAALAKVGELKESIEGKHDATTPATAPGTTGTTGERTAATGEGLAATAGQTAHDIGEKAKSALGYGLAQLQALGKQIDDRTATADQPGLISRVGAAYQSGVEQLEKAVGIQDHAGSTANLTTAEEGGAPTSTTAGSGAHPITTTTNAIPHAESSPAVQKTEETEAKTTGESITAPPKV